MARHRHTMQYLTELQTKYFGAATTIERLAISSELARCAKNIERIDREDAMRAQAYQIVRLYEIGNRFALPRRAIGLHWENGEVRRVDGRHANLSEYYAFRSVVEETFAQEERKEMLVP